MQVKSNLRTDLAYDGGAEAKAAGLKHRVVIAPGVNDLSDMDEKVVSVDAFFAKHVAKGFLEVFAASPAQPVPHVIPEVAADPRAQRPGESKKAYTARLAQLDATAAADADPEMEKFVADFLGMSDEEQAAMEPMLDEKQKEAVAAARAKVTP